MSENKRPSADWLKRVRESHFSTYTREGVDSLFAEITALTQEGDTAKKTWRCFHCTLRNRNHDDHQLYRRHHLEG